MAIYCLPTMQINCLFPSLVSDNFFAKVQNLNCFLMFPLHLSLLKNIIPDFNSNWKFPIKWEPEEGQKFISSWNSHLLSTTVNNINFLGFVWHITSWVSLLVWTMWKICENHVKYMWNFLPCEKCCEKKYVKF